MPVKMKWTQTMVRSRQTTELMTNRTAKTEQTEMTELTTEVFFKTERTEAMVLSEQMEMTELMTESLLKTERTETMDSTPPIPCKTG